MVLTLSPHGMQALTIEGWTEEQCVMELMEVVTIAEAAGTTALPLTLTLGFT